MLGNMKARVLLNPISGRGRQPEDDLSDLRRIFAEHGIEVQVVRLQMRGQAVQLSREAVDQGFDLVVAIGGDGTINEVVCGLVHSTVPLGIVPAGSGNGMARAFGVPLNRKQACMSLLQGHTREVDVGELNGRFFLGVAGIGYDALVGKLFEERWGGHRGLLPYVHSALLAFFQYKALPVHLQFNGRGIDLLPKLVTVANTPQFGAGAVIAPQAKPDDGLFDVCAISDLSFFQALYHWPKIFLKQVDRMPQWEMFRTDSLEISSDLPLPVHVDGEPIGEYARLRISLLPRALRILVPDDVPSDEL
jgi:diacylglycerol kinase (ATP)